MRRLTLPIAAVILLCLLKLTSGAPVEAQRQTCSSFPTQAAAQAAYRANPVGLANLDADHDGIACESNRCPCDRTPVNLNRQPTPPTPVPPVPAPTRPAPPPPAPTAAPAPEPAVTVAPEGWARVARLIDGDTVELDTGVRVRLFGIDAPETTDRCGGEATETLRGLLTDAGRDYAVYLEYGPRTTDQFGRTLAYLWVQDGESMAMVDEWMVILGAARAWMRDGQYRDAIVAREGEAQAAAAGCLWAA